MIKEGISSLKEDFTKRIEKFNKQSKANMDNMRKIMETSKNPRLKLLSEHMFSKDDIDEMLRLREKNRNKGLIDQRRMSEIMLKAREDAKIENEKNKSDIAIYVLSRNMGEGADRRPIKGEVLLTETEIKDILYLDKNYKKFMLVLNVGGVVDLSPVKNVSNILLLSQLGIPTGDVLADIILGKSNPSGKLATTWASYNDYKFINEFGNLDDTNYLEGVYVGYRYFDSVGINPLYPIGFGKSYTDFNISKISLFFPPLKSQHLTLPS